MGFPAYGGETIKPTERFNLLVTFQGHKNDAAGEELLGIEEIELALQNHESIVSIEKTDFINVVVAQLNMDPLEAAMKLKDAQTTVISKVVPIEEVVRTRTDAILEKVLMLAGQKIGKNESFVVRGDLRGRGYIESREYLVAALKDELTEKLNLKLNEQNPEWIVQIEVVGENTGISILRPGELFKKL